jgi:hypothetical protein
VAQRTELFKILADLPGDQTDIAERLKQLAETMDSMLTVTPEDAQLKAQQAAVYLALATWQLKQSDIAERTDALVYLDKSIATGILMADHAKTILSASNLRSDGKLTEQHIRAALIEGKGVAVTHVLLALDAWKNNQQDRLKFHLELACAQEPHIVETIRYFAVIFARSTGGGDFGATRLGFQDNLSWRQAIQLLDVLLTIDKSDFERDALAKSVIYADKQRWEEVIELLEAHYPKVSDKFRMQFLRALFNASNQSGDQEKLKYYQKLIVEEAKSKEE